jgi:hypothetical protein
VILSYTNAEILEREAKAKAIAAADVGALRAELAKREADAMLDGFVLTGSDRAADDRWNNSLF